jgi:hypothetical protein
VRIVFLLRHALYLRNFEHPLRDLAARGHEISIVFSPWQKAVDTTLLSELKREYPNIREQKVAARTGWWWPVSDGARVLRDFLRYLEPVYDDAPALVARGARRLPPSMIWAFEHFSWLRRPSVRQALARLMQVVDMIIVPDPGVVKALKEWRPDLLLVTSVVEFRYHQTDYAKAARSLGIPTVLTVPSWDNLTNKGLIQICPERVIVWNAIQEREAAELHGVPPDRICKTGAQLFDQWFEMTPSVNKARFCTRVGGLDPSKPIILYLCSSTFICSEEVSFVKEWLSRLRQFPESRLSSANVIVRPHPAHTVQWHEANLGDRGPSVIWPREGGPPLDQVSKRDYFDSLYHASAVVGVNTSGFIEAGILGRRTFALATDRFRATQEGTLHFRYLLDGGLIELAHSFEEHFNQLSWAIDHPEKVQERVKEFITMLIRPAGLGKPASPLFVDAIQSAFALKPQPWVTPFYAPLLRAAIWPLVYRIRRQVLARVNRGLSGGAEATEARLFSAEAAGQSAAEGRDQALNIRTSRKYAAFDAALVSRDQK